MARISVNEIIPSARSLINSFIENMDDTMTMLPDHVREAGTALDRLGVLFEDFHKKIEKFGALRPPIYWDGHLWVIQLRCFGDGDPNNCGRWFMKVSVLYCVTLAADIDLNKV